MGDIDDSAHDAKGLSLLVADHYPRILDVYIVAELMEYSVFEPETILKTGKLPDDPRIIGLVVGVDLLDPVVQIPCFQRILVGGALDSRYPAHGIDPSGKGIYIVDQGLGCLGREPEPPFVFPKILFDAFQLAGIPEKNGQALRGRVTTAVIPEIQSLIEPFAVGRHSFFHKSLQS
jgi:hypothetical protein